MQLKYKFVVRKVNDVPVAVAVGKDNLNFNGMIKLNETGCFIFKLLERNITEEKILEKIIDNYNVSKEVAKNSINNYLDILRKNDLIDE